MDKKIEKSQEKQKALPSKQVRTAEEVSGVESRPTLTPTTAVIMAASATAFHHLTQNKEDSQFGFSVPAEDGGEPDQVTLDLSKCLVSTEEDLGNLSEFLQSS